MFNRIENALKEQEKTLYWLSKETGISQQALYNLKTRPEAELSATNLKAVANVLGKPMEYFVVDRKKKSV